VANQFSDNVSVIDTATNMTVGLPIQVGSNPLTVAITPDGARLYVANVISNNVSVIDTAANTVVATITGGNFPIGAAVTPDGTRLYVANFNSNNVLVINTAANMVVATITVENSPRSVAITPAPLPSNVPTLSQWGLIAMAGILGIVGFMVMRRRRVTA